MASSGMLKVACVVLVCMVVTAPQAQALSCGTVTSKLVPCLSFLKNGGAVPVPCCNGAKDLYNLAKTTADRQDVCKCLKSSFTTIPGIMLNYASSLPSRCGISVPYKISPTTDCSKVQ